MATITQTNSAWKKYFYSGIGLASHSKDIVQKSVNEFVKQGRVNEADGKKIVDSAIQKLEAGYNEAIHKLSKYTDSEVSKLKGQIEKLEKQISVKSKTASKKAAASASPAKKKVAKRKPAHK